MTVPDMTYKPEVESKYPDNEIQSRSGRAFFDTFFHGGITVESGVLAYMIADRVAESTVIPMTFGGVGAIAGLTSTIALKRLFSRAE
jgi:hypothetical protein